MSLPVPSNPRLYLFDDRAADHQRRYRTDLVLYSSIVSQTVRVAWYENIVVPNNMSNPSSRPMFADRRIPPKYLLEFLQRNNLHWTCFCVIGGDNLTSLSCRILDAGLEGVYGYCHHQNARCRFFREFSFFHPTT